MVIAHRTEAVDILAHLVEVVIALFAKLIVDHIDMAVSGPYHTVGTPELMAGDHKGAFAQQAPVTLEPLPDGGILHPSRSNISISARRSAGSSPR